MWCEFSVQHSVFFDTFDWTMCLCYEQTNLFTLVHLCCSYEIWWKNWRLNLKRGFFICTFSKESVQKHKSATHFWIMGVTFTEISYFSAGWFCAASCSNWWILNRMFDCSSTFILDNNRATKEPKTSFSLSSFRLATLIRSWLIVSSPLTSASSALRLLGRAKGLGAVGHKPMGGEGSLDVLGLVLLLLLDDPDMERWWDVCSDGSGGQMGIGAVVASERAGALTVASSSLLGGRLLDSGSWTWLSSNAMSA